MEDSIIRNFEQLRSPTLLLTRHGFLNPRYELSDGQFTYGKLSHSGFVKQKTIIETAGQVWEFTHKGWRGGLDINTAEGQHVGQAQFKGFGRKITLSFDGGEELTYKQPSIWKRDFYWTDAYDTQLIRIRALLSTSKAFEIELINAGTDHQKTLLLIFTGIKMNMMQQAAAAV